MCNNRLQWNASTSQCFLTGLFPVVADLYLIPISKCVVIWYNYLIYIYFVNVLHVPNCNRVFHSQDHSVWSFLMKISQTPMINTKALRNNSFLNILYDGTNKKVSYNIINIIYRANNHICHCKLNIRPISIQISISL